MYGFCLVLVWFLQVLETCVNICGERFHNEIAKFRFLNELIKVLSPKVGGPGYAGCCRGDTLFILHWMWKSRTNLRAESVLCPQTQTLDVNPPVKGVNQLWKGFHLWLLPALLGRLGTLQEIEIVLWPLSLWPFCLAMIYSTLIVEMAEDWAARSCPEPVPWFCVPCPQTSAVQAALELLKYPPAAQCSIPLVCGSCDICTCPGCIFHHVTSVAQLQNADFREMSSQTRKPLLLVPGLVKLFQCNSKA